MGTRKTSTGRMLLILLRMLTDFPLWSVKTSSGVRQRERVDIDLHQLELRFEGLRTKSVKKERRLMASVAAVGQQLPVVVVRDEEPRRYVVVDGYKRVRVLKKLRRDRARTTVWELEPVPTLIKGQWDQLVRVAASLRNRTAPAHVVLERLAASGPSDTLAKAVTAMGRVVKTVYILRYLHDESLQQRVQLQLQLQLNRGESRHQLARRLFFANQGAFRTGDSRGNHEQGERPEPTVQCGSGL